MNTKLAKYAGAVTLAMMVSASYAADTTNPSTKPDPMTGKEKATAIGATTGAVAGAVVGGPVGAVVGAGIGGYVGHEGTNANGKVTNTGDAKMGNSGDTMASSGMGDITVKDAQAALEQHGYNPGAIDGQMGPNTRNALVRFQQDKGLTASGTLDGATLSALGVPR